MHDAPLVFALMLGLVGQVLTNNPLVGLLCACLGALIGMWIEDRRG